jgi:hypothetical protein
MRVLVACEFSGVVRSAFRTRGHDAWSCDLLPAEDGSRYHYQHDAVLVANSRPHMFDPLTPWDLLIAHPPCTYLCNSGGKWLYKGGRKENGPDPERWRNMEAASDFFLALLKTNVPRKAIENPIMHRHAAERIGSRATQFIQPWQHGHGEIKATGLHLVNLPPLVPSNVVEGRVPRVHHASPGEDRWKERSRTLPGIAAAMAVQ